MNTVEDTSDFGLVFCSIHPSLYAPLSAAVVLSGLIDSPLVSSIIYFTFYTRPLFLGPSLSLENA